jgi:hypothetical protein
MLIVSPAETLSGLIVTATSVDDPAKSGTSMITIPATPAAVVPATPPPAPQAQAPAAGTPYIITGSGGAFTATRGGATIGTANQPLQTVIEGIRTNAAGSAVTIQFGDGNAVLNNGALSVWFNNTGGTWGAITLTGRITSGQNVYTEATPGTIGIANNISVNSTADIINTINGSAIYNTSSGTLTISGGTVQAGGGVTVQCSASTGTINITGGTLSSSSNRALNNGAATVNISGGTLSSSTGYALVMNGNGKVTISGSARLTSNNTSATQGTIFLSAAATSAGGGLTITGGTVINTTLAGNAIYKAGNATITASGGTIQAGAATSFAINNAGGGTVTTTGATVIGRVGP